MVVHLTRELIGGLLVGLGVGMVIGGYIAAPSPVGLGLCSHGMHISISTLMLALIMIGGWLARSAQRGGTMPSRNP
jgi:hypothetical protein